MFPTVKGPIIAKIIYTITKSNTPYDYHHIGGSNWALLAQFLSDLNADFGFVCLEIMLIVILRGA